MITTSNLSAVYPVAQPGGEAAGCQPAKKIAGRDLQENNSSKGEESKTPSRRRPVYPSTQPGGEAAGSQESKAQRTSRDESDRSTDSED
jgi:hypothetical protein